MRTEVEVGPADAGGKDATVNQMVSQSGQWLTVTGMPPTVPFGSLSLIDPRQPPGIDAQGVSGAQPPHEQDRAPDAVALPAPAGGYQPHAQADRACAPAQMSRQGDVLHERDVR